MMRVECLRAGGREDIYIKRQHAEIPNRHKMELVRRVHNSRFSSLTQSCM